MDLAANAGAYALGETGLEGVYVVDKNHPGVWEVRFRQVGLTHRPTVLGQQNGICHGKYSGPIEFESEEPSDADAEISGRLHQFGSVVGIGSETLAFCGGINAVAFPVKTDGVPWTVFSRATFPACQANAPFANRIGRIAVGKR